MFDMHEILKQEFCFAAFLVLLLPIIFSFIVEDNIGLVEEIVNLPEITMRPICTLDLNLTSCQQTLFLGSAGYSYWIISWNITDKTQTDTY